jgi:glycosyltransferase involved in cell wall biosynthesis
VSPSAVKPRIGVLSVPWTGVPPKNSLGSIGNIVHEITRPLRDRYSFVLVGGTSRSKEREVDDVEYVAINDEIDRRYLDPLLGAVDRVRAGPRSHGQRAHFHTRYATEAADQLAKAGCDVVFALEYPQWLPILRRRVPRARLVYWGESGISVHSHGDAFARYVSHADGAIACSRYVAECILQRAPALRGKVHVAYNGFDPERFRPAPETVATRTIMSVGRVTPDKGAHVLVDAFRSIAIDRPDLELVIAGPLWITDPASLLGVGKGHEDEIETLARPNLPSFRKRVERKLKREPPGPSPYRSELERRAGPVLDRVHYAGSLVDDDLPRQLAGCLAFVQPSLVEEGLPLTSVEAMGCGLPLVASNRGGTQELVEEGGNGFVVPSGDAEALAAALLPIVNDNAVQRRMADRSHSLSRRYTWAASAEALAGAIDGLLVER